MEAVTATQNLIARIPSETASFFRDGFYAPIPLLTTAQFDLTRRHLKLGTLPDPLEWEKGRAATDRFLYDLATRPALLSLLRPLLGDDIILWGAGVLAREPGHVHPWHSDIESSAPDQHFASVWIGIENTSRESALQIISRSHLFGKMIQEVAHEKGVRRGEASAQTVLAWARDRDSDAEFIQPTMQDGDALIFDGRLWHGSDNIRSEGCRLAILFQYAAAQSPVLMPNFAYLEWPFRYKESRVPVILVSGKNGSGTNRVVPPPVDASEQITAEVHPIALPVPEDSVARWKPHHLFEGGTPNFHRMGAHYSVLSCGHCPHPPHAHREEELLIVLEGEAELVIPDATLKKERIEHLRPGSFVYYPAYQHHTIRNASASPISYLMFKWTGSPVEIESPLETKIVDPNGVAPQSASPFAVHFLFEGPTGYLGKLHAHLTVLQPGGGYEPHTDEHDVAIVLLAGKLETLGQTVEHCGVICCAAGQLHGMKNLGREPARYLVFEFHALNSG
jgi:mannose-6-phosphate isomerase-like protein (cupin superfamily)